MGRILRIKKEVSQRLNGEEEFTDHGKPLGIKTIDLWSWFFSDLHDIGSQLAEFLVSKSLKLKNPCNTGYWISHQIRYKNKLLGIREIAFLGENDEDGHPLRKTRNIDIRDRKNDIYVFCLYKGNSPQTNMMMEISNWEFYVVPIWLINSACRTYNTIRLTRLQKMIKPVDYGGLKNNIDMIIQKIDTEYMDFAAEMMRKV